MRSSLRYTASPLLADKTPVWRSRTIVGGLALAFTALVARAAYVQVIDSEFFKREGNVRFVRTLELPASRGRIYTIINMATVHIVVKKSKTICYFTPASHPGNAIIVGKFN